MNQKERLITARHEAGHVLNALFCGVTFDRVTIEPKEAGVYGIAGLSCSAYEYAQIGLGGLAGSRVNHKRPGKVRAVDLFSQLLGDWPKVSSAIQELAALGNVDEWADEILIESWKCIQQYKHSFDQIVANLLAHETLSYEECRSAFVGH